MTNHVPLLTWRAQLLLATLSCVSCGDAVVDSTYRGAPLFVISGVVFPQPGLDVNRLMCDEEYFVCFEACYPQYYAHDDSEAENEFDPWTEAPADDDPFGMCGDTHENCIAERGNSEEAYALCNDLLIECYEAAVDQDSDPSDDEENEDSTEEVPTATDEPVMIVDPASDDDATRSDDNMLQGVAGAAEEACNQQCDLGFSNCLKGSRSFEDIYLDPFNNKKIGVLWADAQQNPAGKIRWTERLQQPGVTAAGFPGRYAMTVHRPPVDEALFSTERGRYAFGLFVVFEDSNGDGFLQLPGESIIGLNQNEFLIYSPNGVATASGEALPAGYQRATYADFCESEGQSDTEAETSEDGASQPGSIEITGNIVSVFDGLPSPTCEADITSWRALCLAEAWRCTRSAFALESFCTFCQGEPTTATDLR